MKKGKNHTKKKGSIAFLIIALIALAGGIGLYFYYPKLLLQQKLNNASQFLSSGSYQEAYDTYENVLKADPENAEASAGRKNAYDQWISSSIDNNDLETAVQVISEAQSLFQDANYTEQLKDVWQKRIDAAENNEESLALCQSAYCNTGDVSFGEQEAAFKNKEEIQNKASKMIAEALEDGFPVCDDAADFADQYFSIQENLKETGEEKYLVDTDKGRIGFYKEETTDEETGEKNVGYYAYIGDYKEDKRDGEGRWIAVYNPDSYYIVSTDTEWIDDEPDGDFTEITISKDSVGSTTSKGKQKNGLWDGEITVNRSDNQYDTMIMNVDNGVIQPVDTGENEYGKFILTAVSTTSDLAIIMYVDNPNEDVYDVMPGYGPEE